MKNLNQRLLSLLTSAAVWLVGFSALASYAQSENIFDNRLLVGAKNIDVSGELWNVEFLDGTCISTFEGCDSQQDFAFSTKEDADAAGAALLQHVITGNVSDKPWLIRGCDLSLDNCSIWTPYQLFPGAFILHLSEVINYPAPYNSYDACCYGVSISTTYDTTGFAAPLRTFAVWQQVSQVPEPAASLMLLTGLLALVCLHRSRRSGA